MIYNGRKGSYIELDPHAKTAQAESLEAWLQSRVIGQERAIRSITSLYQVFHAGMTDSTRPVGTMLFLGPTGSGKTHIVEEAAEVLFGSKKALVKIDCAEFQHSHEIAKLIGSPPGYLGHRETAPLLTQENLDKYRTERDPFTFVLFDEIEKASDALWQLLLGVLDRSTLTLGDNRRVDFSKTIIIMTSNLGAKEMSETIEGRVGFAPPARTGLRADVLDQMIYRVAIAALRKRFSPEFVNRIDKVVVFRALKHEELRQILDLELEGVQRRIDRSDNVHFKFFLTDEAKEFTLEEGIDQRYGARHLKRAIERLLVVPLANLSATRQVKDGDTVIVELHHPSRKLIFLRESDEAYPAAAAAHTIPFLQALDFENRVAA
ncbi:MAG TPA: AAA family ATPase [Blastocatellia bacterium]|nr:AAA family ATPase [Blastocatellia bacterium]